MKKFSKILVFVLFAVMLLTGCTDDEIVSSLVTHATTDSAWQYYYNVDNLKTSFSADLQTKVGELQTDQNVVKKDLEKYYYTTTGKQYISDVIMDCISVIDTFDAREKLTLFDFADKQGYQVRETKTGSQYTVTYKQNLQRTLVLHNTPVSYENENSVDELIFNVPLVTEVKITISKNELNTNLYNLNIEKNVKFPEEIAEYESSTRDSNNNSHIKKLVVQQTEVTSSKPYTQVILTASEVVKSQNGTVLASYERESKYLMQNNHFFIRDTVKRNSQIVRQDNLRVDNTFSNVAIKYEKAVGYLNYDLAYNLAGAMKVSGEVYFQGINKYILKEFVSITQGSPFGLNESYILEESYDVNTAKQKIMYVGNQTVYVNLRDQNLMEFATHTQNDGNSAFAEKTALGETHISFYS